MFIPQPLILLRRCSPLTLEGESQVCYWFFFLRVLIFVWVFAILVFIVGNLAYFFLVIINWEWCAMISLFSLYAYMLTW